ncbi:hypothetical protein [Pseudovibrio sp. Tun.PSC04-5.I4]|uniref:hypothetical protein n=1 Tax=Pseudovibrio sp. Tun.PSC04-5.I4 TaxID=1798213 RepID=UPI000AC4D814|nr:hypothetical protein [Pseudovibrio sp. Tun.PSC04-5.I4]
MRTHRCQQTDDLLSWQPPQVEARFDPTRVRAATAQAKVCRALSEAFKVDQRSREEIATVLSKQLAATVWTHGRVRHGRQATLPGIV